MRAVKIGHLLGQGKTGEILKNEDINLGYFLANGELEDIIPGTLHSIDNISDRIYSILSGENTDMTKKDKLSISIVNEIDATMLPEKYGETIAYLQCQLLLCIGKKPSISILKSLVADYFTLSAEELVDKTRRRKIAKARQIIMFFAAGMELSTSKDISSQLRLKDHSTVLHGVKTINNLLESRDNDTIKEVKDIIRILYTKCYFNITNFKHDRTRENIHTIIQPPFSFVDSDI